MFRGARSPREVMFCLRQSEDVAGAEGLMTAEEYEAFIAEEG